MKRSFRLILGLAVTLLCLFFVFRRLDWPVFLAAFRQLDWGLLLLATVIYLTGYLTRTWRWQILVQPLKNIPLRRLFPVLVMGFMFNNILPARLGEFARAYLTGQREGISKTAAFATVVLERVFDGMIIVLFFGLASLCLFSHHPDNSLASQFLIQTGFQLAQFQHLLLLGALFSTLIFFGVFGICLLMLAYPDGTMTLVSRLAGKLPAKYAMLLQKIARLFLDGLLALRNRQALILLFFFSLCSWSLESIAYFLIFRAFHLPLSPIFACLVMTVVNLVIMIPSTAGGLGPFEIAGVGMMVLYGSSKSQGLPAILMIHLLIIVPITLLGLFYLWRDHISIREIQANAASEQAL
jgi:uncharacterized protein (TIRG00374 family)